MGRTINLITTRCENPLAAVAYFHSTLVMNAITADGIICLYPLLTINGRGIALVDTPRTRMCFSKYKQRGFRFSRDFDRHICKTTAYCKKSLRSISDDQNLEVSFEPNVIGTVARKFAPFEWQLDREEAQ